ncbi:MAG: hypothetical protein ACLQU3_34790 [Limisphaerales bacterium]
MSDLNVSQLKALAITMMTRVAEATAKCNKLCEPEFIKAAEGMRKCMAVLPTRLRIMAEHGWFISGGHIQTRVAHLLADTFQNGRVDEANKTMCWHINQILPKVEESLVKDFPRRATIIGKAFAAHRSRDYELSIPVLLSQADGIAREAIAESSRGFSITSRKKEFQSVVRQFIDENAGSFISHDILQVILEQLPLNASEGDQKLKPGVLNRNAILHGTDTAYATELNSCRAISWIEFASRFKWMGRMGKHRPRSKGKS